MSKQMNTFFYFAFITVHAETGTTQVILCETTRDALGKALDDYSESCKITVDRVVKGYDLPFKKSFSIG